MDKSTIATKNSRPEVGLSGKKIIYDEDGKP